MKSPDAILISHIPNIIYLTGYSGFSETEREAFILISNSKKFIITDKRYSEEIEKSVNGFTVIDSGAINFIKNEIKDFFRQYKINSLGIEVNDITVAEYSLLKKVVKLIPHDFSKERLIKSQSEIKNISTACKIGDDAFKHILSKIKIGITEKQIADELIYFFKSNDADLSFPPIVAFGSHSSSPHHQNTNEKLKRNQIILLDYGVKFNNYCSDMTRTVFFGEIDKKFIEIYETVKNSQQAAIDYVNKSVNKNIYLKDIDKVAREYILNKGYDSIPHALGHGIGIEVHESPTISSHSKDTLQNNTVFSIEPGIYLPGYGGVRIEDLVVVKNMKLELLSHSNREIINIHD